jgi:hypothetical protein
LYNVIIRLDNLFDVFTHFLRTILRGQFLTDGDWLDVDFDRAAQVVHMMFHHSAGFLTFERNDESNRWSAKDG